MKAPLPLLALALLALPAKAEEAPDPHANMPGMRHGQHAMDHGAMDHSAMDHSAMHHASGPAGCGDDSVWDFSTGMCAPLPAEGRRQWMVHGNTFLTQVFEEGPRGRDRFAVPNMVMADLGESLGRKHYLNLDLMLTAEKWTFPEHGYPLLFQVGEEDEAGVPFVDAQHPHSSPLMGLTLSDTIRLGEGKDHLKLFFAPRGQPTEGPTAFMHRPTGMVNPDAPLGHHVGQDVSHISSTVLGASWGFGGTRVEASAFHGAEPEPESVDLPFGAPNSYALRFIRQLGGHHAVMASAGYVREPEEHDPSLDHVWRVSGSWYADALLGATWRMQNALVYGLITDYDHVATLQSVLEELWAHAPGRPYNVWGRLEFVQRSAGELAVASGAPNDARWVTALTLGYSHDVATLGPLAFRLGVSGTQTWAPEAFRGAYGGQPRSARAFLELHGMGMGDL
jgi:hypothetical protein